MGYIQEIRKKIGHDMVIVVGAGVFVYQGRRLLLQQRRDNLCWSMHGGCVEVGESVEAAAKRELFEETGLTANRLDLLGVFSGEDMLYTYPNGDQVCIIGAFYLCDDFSGEMLAQSEEILSLEWFDIDNLPQNISPPDIRPLAVFIQHIKQGPIAGPA